MDAENDNDQPNSSASASVSASSSNNSSSSNLLGHLPMLPFMRSTEDDDEQEEPDGMDNDLHEEPMPLQSSSEEAVATAALVTQSTLAPVPTTASTTTSSSSSSASTGSSSSSSTTAVGMVLEPMVGAEQLAVTTLMASPSVSSSMASSVQANRSLVPPSSALLPFANPSHVIFSPFLFNIPPSSNAVNPLTPPSGPLNFQTIENSSLTPSTSSSSTSLTSPSLSSAASSSSLASSSHQKRFNLAQPQLSLFHEQNPIPTSSFSISFQQQHQHQVSPQAPSSLAQQQDHQPQPEQQHTAHINRNDIADTIDASAVLVQPIEANADQLPHLETQSVAAADQNDIQLDDNDNNDFDVDLNLRNNDAITNASSSSAIHQQQSSRQLQQQPSSSLDSSASGSAGPSNSAGQQTLPQPPTTLPLLLYQQQQPQPNTPTEQQQPQQTEESKHLPSYDHHYHNPREFHLHSHPYQHPCLYPYGFGTTPYQSTEKNGNGAFINSTNSIMFGNTSSSVVNHGHSSTSGLGVAVSSTPQVVDRLKLLYPNVNENETPLPRCWSPHDKCLSIGLSQNNLRVHFKGVGKQNNDAASVRTAHPIPPACGIYYFEVKIISKGKNGYMGIGLTAQQFRMNRLPGWDKQSYGYHGDDGNSFSSSGHGQSYGPTFTTGDIIGCCVNFVNNTCFYTKNGIDLGIAFRDLPTKLYPTVGLQTPGEEVDANFGQEPFKFDQIEDMMKQMRAEMKATIYDFPLPAEQGDPTTLLQKMVSSYLVHNGYSETAEAFGRQKTGQNLREDVTSIRNRQKILKLVMSGKMGQAIEQTVSLYPGLLENNKNLCFMLKCRQFIEMINGSDVEYGPLSSISTINKTTPNQTSVIQSTKTYQNGNGPNQNNSNGSLTTANTTATTTTTNSTTNSNSNTSTTATTTAATTLTVGGNNSNKTTAATLNNAQNSNHITVINTDDDDDDNDIKHQTDLVDHCSATEVAPIIISKSNNDYLNDVEMENNGHTSNGNVCKNGNTNNFNDSIDADEEMDVDVSPSIKKYSHGIERILEFGKDLSQMGQQLEKENKMTDDERQMLEDAFSLIAYSNPWASPLGWQLCPTKRETVCRALNSAILESMNYPKWPPLEYCVAHANELLKVMAQNSLGACAFVNIADVFPKN